jgi:hypothetical protein
MNLHNCKHEQEVDMARPIRIARPQVGRRGQEWIAVPRRAEVVVPSTTFDGGRARSSRDIAATDVFGFLTSATGALRGQCIRKQIAEVVVGGKPYVLAP